MEIDQGVIIQLMNDLKSNIETNLSINQPNEHQNDQLDSSSIDSSASTLTTSSDDELSLETKNETINEMTKQDDINSNEILNDQFKKMLEDDSSSSSSSTESFDKDDTEKKLNRSKKLIKIKPTDEDDEDEDSDEDDNTHKKTNIKPKYIKTKDELTVDDLGPIEKIEINLEADIKLKKLGKVISKVDNKLIVIQSLRNDLEPNLPPLDEDTILFDSNRKSLGKIFETFGPVSSPFYSIRFNSLKEIEDRELDLEIDSFVFYAQSQKYTKFVFNVEELRKQKGSDASWNNDNEPPTECLDYSDDEQEKLAKRRLKSSKAGKSDSDSEDTVEDADETVEKKSTQKSNNKFNNKNRQFNKKEPNNQNHNNQTGYKRKYDNNQFPRSNSYAQSSFNSSINNNNNQINHHPQMYSQLPQQQMFRPNMMPPQQMMMPPMINQFYPYQYPPVGPGFNPAFYHHPQFYQQNASYQYFQQHQQQYQAAPVPNNNNNNNNNNNRPSASNDPQIVDKRFIKNPNFVKKSF